MDNLQLRMYVLVPYNLSPIQQGIQALHASLEYALQYGHTDLFKDFVTNHKTVILLNGGTTRESDVRGNLDASVGTMQAYLYGLEDSTQVRLASFSEPDLNHTLTAFCFICDERVWNYEFYPEFEPTTEKESVSEYNRRVREYIEILGGKDNLALRLFLKDKKLA